MAHAHNYNFYFAAMKHLKFCTDACILFLCTSQKYLITLNYLEVMFKMNVLIPGNLGLHFETLYHAFVVNNMLVEIQGALKFLFPGSAKLCQFLPFL